MGTLKDPIGTLQPSPSTLHHKHVILSFIIAAAVPSSSDHGIGGLVFWPRALVAVTIQVRVA